MKISKNMISTAFELPNHTIIESLGIVKGISVRSLSIAGGFVADLQTILGGNITRFTKLCEKTREEAFNIVIEQAESLNANAIIGFRYDANEIASGVTEVLAYGTAVIVRKN